jgi:hypothetical protein
MAVLKYQRSEVVHTHTAFPVTQQPLNLELAPDSCMRTSKKPPGSIVFTSVFLVSIATFRSSKMPGPVQYTQDSKVKAPNVVIRVRILLRLPSDIQWAKFVLPAMAHACTSWLSL